MTMKAYRKRGWNR